MTYLLSHIISILIIRKSLKIQKSLSEAINEMAERMEPRFHPNKLERDIIQIARKKFLKASEAHSLFQDTLERAPDFSDIENQKMLVLQLIVEASSPKPPLRPENIKEKVERRIGFHAEDE